MVDLRGFMGWAELTDLPFLRLLRRGEVSSGAFERWLVQEKYLYEAMLGLQTSLLRRASVRHRLIIANAILITVEELDWLANLELPPIPIHPTRQSYLAFLESLEQAPYPVGTVAHWARHRAFFDAWSSLPSEELPGLAGIADELVQHWMAPEAQALIHDLGSLALEVSTELSPKSVEQIVSQILLHEQSAWAMALAFALGEA